MDKKGDGRKGSTKYKPPREKKRRINKRGRYKIKTE
jgi:hypothetical protein